MSGSVSTGGDATEAISPLDLGELTFTFSNAIDRRSIVTFTIDVVDAEPGLTVADFTFAVTSKIGSSSLPNASIGTPSAAPIPSALVPSTRLTYSMVVEPGQSVVKLGVTAFDDIIIESDETLKVTVTGLALETVPAPQGYGALTISTGSPTQK